MWESHDQLPYIVVVPKLYVLVSLYGTDYVISHLTDYTFGLYFCHPGSVATLCHYMHYVCAMYALRQRPLPMEEPSSLVLGNGPRVMPHVASRLPPVASWMPACLVGSAGFIPY